MPKLICAWCDVEFEAKAKDANRGKKYCKAACYHASRQRREIGGFVWCDSCEGWKPEGSFVRSKNRQNRVVGNCADCNLVTQRAYRAENAEEVNVRQNKYRRRKRGISEDAPLFYNRMTPEDERVYRRIITECKNRHHSDYGFDIRSFNLTWQYLAEQAERQDGNCAYTGLPLVLSRSRLESDSKGMFGAISVDRIDSRKGYEKGNVLLCSAMANIWKCDHDLKAWVDMCQAVVNNREVLKTLIPSLPI